MADPKQQERGQDQRVATVIYRPQDGDPHTTEIRWGDREDQCMRFRANEAVQIPHTLAINQLIVEKFENKEGLLQSRSSEKRVPLYRVLSNNPSFEVDGQQAQRVKPFARLPDTPDEYRGYAVTWIAASMDAKAIDIRWVGEQGLRERCGVSAADEAYIKPFLEARKQEAARFASQAA